MSKPHMCPHHCPGGKAGVSGATVAITALAVLVSTHAGQITSALMIVLACLAVVSAAGITLLIILVRGTRGSDRAELPYARTRERGIESQAPAALAGQRPALPRRQARALPAGQRSGCPACGYAVGHGPECRFARPLAVRRPY